MARSRKPDDESYREYGRANQDVGADFDSRATRSHYGAIQRVDFTGHGLLPLSASTNLRGFHLVRFETVISRSDSPLPD